jgi:ATP:ADP antiporter, AAA family
VLSILRMIQSVVRIERREWGTWAVAFTMLFLLLCGYYMIRPIRETLGVQIGSKYFHWLFTATFLSMLAVNPVFGALAARWSRRFLVPMVYGLFLVTLFVFALLMRGNSTSFWLAAVFYVWVSVFNYIAVSLFWSVMTDLFSVDQGKRLFGAISAGGTLGALCGPLITDRFVGRIGASGILALSAVVFALVTLCAVWLSGTKRLVADASESNDPKDSGSIALGGSPWAGMAQTFASPYLLAIGIYMLLGSSLGSMIYTEQGRIVETQIAIEDRPQFFARTDFAVNSIALVLELLVAGPLFFYAGLRLPMLALPLIGLIGVPLLGASPTAITVAALLVMRRATEYAIAKPAREVLFTVVTREQKYKAKNFIDTVLARGGDAIGAWAPAALFSLLSPLGFGSSNMLYASIPFGIVFGAIGWWLASEQRRKLTKLK